MPKTHGPSKIRVSFVDMWPAFDPENNFILDALRKFCDPVLVTRRADILFYSVFGWSNLSYLGKKVLVNPEIFDLDYGRPDFSIGFPESSKPDRLRFPFWAWRESPDLKIPSADRFPVSGARFCNFVYSNDKCEFRNRFYTALDRRRSVDSLGRLFRPATVEAPISDRYDLQNWRTSKTAALSNYRFTLAFENVSAPGYTTEKIVDAFTAGSIPVYWGDPFVADEFNAKAFVNVHDFSNPMDAIDHVLALDDSPEAVAAIRSEPPMSENQWTRYFDDQLSDFLQGCVAADTRPVKLRAYRALRGAISIPGTWQFRAPLVKKLGLTSTG